MKNLSSFLYVCLKNVDADKRKRGCSTNPVGEKSPTGFFTCKKEKSEL